MSQPYIIEFDKLGKSEIGYISVCEIEKILPFNVKRIFWTYYTPESITRGRHAHKETNQVLIAVAGTINLTLESPDGIINEYKLDSPDKGVFIPHDCWHTMQYSHNAVQLVFASTEYNENEYIRSYDDFKKLK